jgi:hypothetical protein
MSAVRNAPAARDAGNARARATPEMAVLMNAVPRRPRAPTRREGDAPQPPPAAASGHARRRARVADSQARMGQLLPIVLGAAQALRVGAARGRPAGVCPLACRRVASSNSLSGSDCKSQRATSAPVVRRSTSASRRSEHGRLSAYVDVTDLRPIDLGRSSGERVVAP